MSDTSSDAGVKQMRDIWNQAGCWEEFLDLNRAFLRGETSSTAYYIGAIDDETAPMAEDLLTLHDYGFFTWESQPARVEGPGKHPKLVCPCHAFVHSKQRAFLSLLLPTRAAINEEMITSFCDALIADQRFHTSILSYSGLCRRGCCRTAPQIRSNFPEKWETHMRTYAQTRKQLRGKELKPFQHIDPWCGSIVSTLNGDTNDLMRTYRPLVINVLAKDYKDINLAMMIKMVADEVGMESEYLEYDSEDDSPDSSAEDSDESM